MMQLFRWQIGNSYRQMRKFLSDKFQSFRSAKRVSVSWICESHRFHFVVDKDFLVLFDGFGCDQKYLVANSFKLPVAKFSRIAICEPSNKVIPNVPFHWITLGWKAPRVKAESGGIDWFEMRIHSLQKSKQLMDESKQYNFLKLKYLIFQLSRLGYRDLASTVTEENLSSWSSLP